MVRGDTNQGEERIVYFHTRIYKIFFVLYLPLVGRPDGGEDLSGTPTEAEKQFCAKVYF